MVWTFWTLFFMYSVLIVLCLVWYYNSTSDISKWLSIFFAIALVGNAIAARVVAISARKILNSLLK